MASVNQIPLLPDATYHIYNRANANDLLFKSNENYRYFLKKYQDYINPLASTFCYCLMPNHFHFLVRIKDEQQIEEWMQFKMQKQKNKLLQGFETLEGVERKDFISNYISQQWSHLFNGYTQAFNKKYNRKGSLFMRSFKRKQVQDVNYLKKLVHYIHYNPVEASLVSKPEEWNFSSYKAITSNKDTKLLKDEVITWFNDLENFNYCHQKPPHLTGINYLG
jgi:REP element-mobilizing transposase RayT